MNTREEIELKQLGVKKDEQVTLSAVQQGPGLFKLAKSQHSHAQKIEDCSVVLPAIHLSR